MDFPISEALVPSTAVWLARNAEKKKGLGEAGREREACGSCYSGFIAVLLYWLTETFQREELLCGVAIFRGKYKAAVINIYVA